ncbi:MAG TPA: DUF5719 family protein [Actinomycetaceae bacterium]|nr:DUF5719 family protein [Actinomycetaceae bacterium]
MSVRKSVGATLAAIALVGALAAAVVAAEVAPLPAADAVPIGQSHAVPAGLVRLVCAPAPVLAEGAVGYDAEFNPVEATAGASLSAVTFPRDEGAATAGLALTPGGNLVALEGEDARAGGGSPVGESAVVEAEPDGDAAALAAAGGVWRSDLGDLRSIVALPCTAAASEQWLVGGSTMVGSSAELTITNPSETPATVRVLGWGSVGPLDLPMLAGLVIAPHSSESYLIEASAAEMERLMLRVSSTGGSVSASLLDTRLDGFTPLGADVVGPTAAPATEQVIPGVALADVEDLTSPAATENFVRIANPGSTGATVTLTLLAADGEFSIPGASEVTIDPGAVFDVSLAALPAGDHAVAVSSDQPVVAAAQIARAGGEGSLDRAWVTASTAAEIVSFAVPGLGEQVGQATLVLANSSDREVAAAVTPYGSDGAAAATAAVTVPARGITAVDVGEFGAPVGLAVRGDAPLNGAAILRAGAADGELIGVLPGTADAESAGEVVVVVRER